MAVRADLPPEDSCSALAVQNLVELGRERFANDLEKTCQNFEADSWDIRSLKDRSVRKNVDNKLYFTRYDNCGQSLPRNYAEVIKSWILLERQSVSNMLHRVNAARILWEAVLARCGGNAKVFKWEYLSEEDLSQAELFMVARKWSSSTIHKQILRLIGLVRFLVARNVCRPLYYTPTTPRPEDLSRHTIAGQMERMEKLPSMRAIEGLADIYGFHATQPADRLRLAAISILIVTGFRVGELLTLPEDCEVRETRNGKSAYGLRYYAEKTRGGEKMFAVRWLTPIGAELAQKAIAEIREITSAARARARILEQNPDRVTIPEVTRAERMSPKQVTQVLGLGNRTSIHRIPADQLPRTQDGKTYFYRASDVEAYLRSMRVEQLWTVNRKNGTYQMLSETLFVVFKYFLHSYKGTSEMLVEPITFGNLSEFLARTGRNRSIFERFGIREEDGTYCRVTSHQFRHWLNDVADKGGLPVDIQTRWLGRQHAKDTEAYLHSTVEERLQWVKDSIRNEEICGPISRVYFELPENERDDFLEGQIQAVHITPMGICIHDFAVEPCPYYLNCVRGCREYLRTKGDQRERTYLIQIKRRTEKALSSLNNQATTEHGETAQAWVQHYQETLDGVEAALSVDDDEGISDGAVVPPFGGKSSRFLSLQD